MKKRSGLNVMARLIVLVKPLTGYMCLSVLMGLAGNLCASFITILGGYAILKVLGFEVSLSLGWIFALALLFGLFRGLLRYGEQGCNHFIAFKLLALIRDKLFGALRKLTPAKLEGRNKGDLIALITSDTELLEVFYAHTISPICIAFFFTIVMMILIGSYSRKLALYALVCYLFVGVVVPLFTSQRSGDTGDRIRHESASLAGIVLDNLRGLAETLQYGGSDTREKKMVESTDRLLEDQRVMKDIASRDLAFTNALIYVFDLGMILFSTALYLEGDVGFDGILIPSFALMSSFGPYIALAALGSTLQSTIAAGNRVLDILDDTPVTKEVTDGKNVAFDGFKGKEIEFAYEKEKILDHVSFEIPAKEIIGIEGVSGSGKSTLLRLLMRFWDPQKGTVETDGTSLDQVNTSCLRDMEAFMTQDTHLFHDTIRNNLKLAKLDASDEEIEAACRKASVHDFIMSLPKGYDTQVGELGDTLSGGERQRLGLAMAFLHEADVLLLDEPTSNLDSLNEAVILRSLKKEQKGRTVVLVSHRPSSLRIADRVIKMESGRVS